MKYNNPFELFEKWIDEAQQSEIIDHTAMTLSTCTKNAIPSSRMVLLKEFNENGFVFFTNYGSKKSTQLSENPYAALCFYWDIIGKQVRINGNVKKISSIESDEYFSTRPRQSQIGAWASKQSKHLESRNALLGEIAKITAKYGFKKIPRPDFWGGFRVEPVTIEFWNQGKFRIHTRTLFTNTKDGWKKELLYP